MKKQLLLIPALVTLIACNNQVKKDDSEVVVCNPDTVSADILTSDLFSDKVLIPLDSAVKIGANPGIYEVDNELYVGDYFLSKKIYRIDNKGHLINTIGSVGKGPNEYLTLSDFEVDTDNNQVIVYSGIDGKKYSYKNSGEFIEAEEFNQPFYKAKKSGDGTWVYLGYANPYNKGRIAKLGSNAKVIAEELDAKFQVMTMDEITPIFHQNGDCIYMRETVNNEIYEIKDTNIEPVYKFDFQKYSIPEEYFKQSSAMKATAYLFSRDFASIKKFMQNDDYAVVEVYVQRTNGNNTIEIGVKDLKKDIWKWYNIKTGNDSSDLLRNGVAALTDHNELIFIVNAQDISNYTNKTIFKNPEILSIVVANDNDVIIKCQLADNKGN